MGAGAGIDLLVLQPVLTSQNCKKGLKIKQFCLIFVKSIVYMPLEALRDIKTSLERVNPPFLARGYFRDGFPTRA